MIFFLCSFNEGLGVREESRRVKGEEEGLKSGDGERKEGKEEKVKRRKKGNRENREMLCFLARFRPGGSQWITSCRTTSRRGAY